MSYHIGRGKTGGSVKGKAFDIDDFLAWHGTDGAHMGGGIALPIIRCIDE
jgi:hypothetical protein